MNPVEILFAWLPALNTSALAPVPANALDWSCLDRSAIVRTKPPPEQLLKSVRTHFAGQRFKYAGYALLLSESFIDRSQGTKILRFDIQGVSDTSVIYVLDDGGHVLDRFLTSYWTSADPKGLRGPNYRVECHK